MAEEPKIEGRSVKLACVLAAVFVSAGVLGIHSALLPPFVTKLGGTAATTGLVIGVYSIVLLFWLTPFTKLSEKFGNKVVFTAGAVLFAAGSLLCAFAKTPNQLVIYRIVQAVGAAFSLNLGSEVPKFFKPERRATAMAVFSVLLGLGGFIFAIASGYIAAAVGYETTFAISGALGVIPIVALPVGLLPMPPPAERPKGQGFLAIIKQKNILIICLSVFVLLLCYMSILSLSPVQVLGLGFPVAQIGLIYGINQVGYALIQIPGGALSDKYGRKWWWVLECFLPPFALLLLAYVPYMPGVPIVLVTVGLALFAGLGLGIGTPSSYALLMESAPTPADIPMAISILFTFCMAPGIAMPYIGRLADVRGFPFAFTVVAVIGFAGTVLSALFITETLKKKEQPSA